mgnify:FL=1
MCAKNASAESLSIVARDALPPSKYEIATARKGKWKIFQGRPLDPSRLAIAVAAVGGIKSAIVKKKMQKVRIHLEIPPMSSFAFQVVRTWLQYFPGQGLSEEDGVGAGGGARAKTKMNTAITHQKTASSVAVQPHKKKKRAQTKKRR